VERPGAGHCLALWRPAGLGVSGGPAVAGAGGARLPLPPPGDKTMTTRRTALRGLAAGAAAALAGPVLTQDDKSAITVLVGAASSMDFTARLIADQLRDSLGRPAIVLSKLGAGQRVALG